MIALSWVAWLRWSHRWIGLLLLLPVTAVGLTGVLLVHESLWVNKEGPKPQGLQRGTNLTTGVGTTSLDLFPRAEAWRERTPDFEAALEHFQAEHGDLPLREVQFRRDPAAGWVIKVKSLPTPQHPEREILWAADQGRVLSAASPGSVDFYRAPTGGWDWKKVVKDIHTGKLLGNIAGQVWADAAGLGMIFLGVSGLLVYGKVWLAKRTQRKTAARVRRQVSTEADPSLHRPAERKAEASPLDDSRFNPHAAARLSQVVARREQW